jgi:hypothetical protein
MRKVEWLNPNKMKIDSGHKTWDNAVQALMTGNVIDDGYHGSYIRPFNLTVMPAGGPCEPGRLRNFDLQAFPNMPRAVRSFVESVTLDDNVIVYEFHHYADGHKTTHGYLVTTTGPEYHELRRFYTGPTGKSNGVVDTATEYLTNPK